MYSSYFKRSVFVLVCLTAVMLVGGAHTFAGVGWFSGISVGQSSFDGYELEAEATMLDDSDTGWIAFGGYQWNSHFAVVGGYVDMGSLNASGDAFGGFTDVISATGAMAAAMGIVPVNKRISFFGTAGVIYWDQDVDWEDEFGPWRGGDSGASPMFGAGANFFLNESQNAGIHVEWNRFMEVGNLDDEISGHENDIDLFSVGFIYRFGL